MAGLDIGKIYELDIQQQRLDQDRQRNSLYEQNLHIERRKQAETEAAHVQREKFKKFEIGTKLLDDPTIPQDFKAKINQMIAQEAGFGDLDMQAMQGSQETLKQIGDAYRKGDRAGLEAGTLDLAYQHPKLALDNLALLEKTQGLSQKALEHRTNLQLNQARLERMHEEHTGWQAAHNEYRPMVETLDAHLNQFGELGPSLYAKSPQARKALLAGNPTVKKLVDEARDRSGVSAMMETEAKKELAYWDAQQRAIDQGESTLSPDIVAIRTESAKQVIRARQAEQKWLNSLRQDTWDKAAFTDLKQVREQLNASVTGAKAKMKSISDERLALQERKFDATQAGTRAVAEAQNRYAGLPDQERTPQAAARIAREVEMRFGVLPNTEDVMKGAKDPNRPLVEVSTYDRKQNVQEAGKLANVNQAITELQQVRNIMVNEDGSINRANLFTGALNLPFTEGRTASQFIKKSVEIKLRAATGAAARKDEIALYEGIFGPSIKDSDELIRYKLDSFETWMQTVADTTDPQGALRARSEELLNKGTISRLNSPEYKQLRQKFPRASSAMIMEFLKKDMHK